MSDKKEETFKVIDRRSSSGAQDNPAEEKKAEGEGFTMKGSKEEAPPEIDFSTLIYSFATGALISMGLAPDPQTKKPKKTCRWRNKILKFFRCFSRKLKAI